MTEHAKAEWDDNIIQNLPDGSYVDRNDSVCYTKNGKFHREDGPAIEYYNGDKCWYRNGEIHREDGPSIEFSNGRKFWFVGGEWCAKESYEETLKIWKMNEAMK